MLYRNFKSVAAIALALACFTGRVSADIALHQSLQPLPIELGTSGGNVNDKSKAFCCSGTLGSLVKDSAGNLYILSNNHVLARADAGVPGEDISQPGLIDASCRVTNTNLVADLSAFIPIKQSTTNVDAAIAAIRTGSVDPSGTILEIGIPSATTPTVILGMGAAKSGRTTGLTCGSIGSINTTVSVQYQQGCGSGKKFAKTFTHQVVVNSSTFSAGGDSGSLIVATDNAAPVALLFAGSSSTTIGNPVGEVTAALGVSFVGDNTRTQSVTCPGTASPSGASVQGARTNGAGPSDAIVEFATSIKEQHEQDIMSDPAVMGVGVGASQEDPSGAVIVIYLEQGRTHRPIPEQIDGVRTQVIRTDRIRAFGWNESAPKACPVD